MLESFGVLILKNSTVNSSAYWPLRKYLGYFPYRFTCIKKCRLFLGQRF